MIDLRKVHEREVFELVSPRPLTWSSVEPTLARLGFTFIDDSAEMMRCDKPAPWQSAALASCTFLLRGTSVYPDESEFDSIRYSILVASLPEEHSQSAIHLLHLLGEELSLPVTYDQAEVSRDASLALLKNWQSDILAEIGDVSGSESVRILILMEYDRKRARMA